MNEKDKITWENSKLQDICFEIAELAVQAMLYEVSCYPTPGLVSPVSNGAHKDMNYYTFLDSTSCLYKHLLLCCREGIAESDEKQMFNNLREIGLEGEKAMLKKTKGINTHKGMLFLLGICCAASCRIIKNKKGFIEISEIIKLMTKGIVSKELKPIKYSYENSTEKDVFLNNLSHGEKIYVKYGCKGIRGEMEEGLPLIFNYSIEFYKNNSDLNNRERLVQTLLGIMQYCEDTTILYRHSFETLEIVRMKTKEVLKLGGVRTSLGREAIKALDEEFSRKGISPGGSADLLAGTVFLYLVEKSIIENKM